MLPNDDRKILRRMIRLHEGFVEKPYPDTKGNLTVGIGQNLNQEMPEQVAIGMEDANISIAIDELHNNLPFFDEIDPVRQSVMIDMVYNMGIGRFLGFHRMINFISSRAWGSAGEELMNSQAAKAAPERYARLNNMLVTGIWASDIPKFSALYSV